MSEPITAVILAAGVGSRLKPYTNDRPKCLVEVGKATILHRALGLLMRSGVSRFVLSTGYREDRIRTALTTAGIAATVVPNPDYATTQNVVSLARALANISLPTRVIKLDGDVLFTSELVERIVATNGTCAAIDSEGSLGAEEMKVRIANDRIVAFGKALDPKTAQGESIGVECFASSDVPVVRDALAAAIRSGRTNAYYEDVYNDVLDRVAFRAVRVASDEWMEVDDEADLLRAKRRFGADVRPA